MGLIIKKSQGIDDNDIKELELKKWLRKNEDKLTVDVMNFTLGEVIFKDPRTKETYIWSESASVLTLPMSVVYSIKQTCPELLTDLILGIVDFYNNTQKKSLTMNEIIQGLDLVTTYEPFLYKIYNIDGIIIESSTNEFKAICDKSPRGVVERLAERYKFLRREGYVDDRTKETVLSDILGNPYIFVRPEDIF